MTHRTNQPINRGLVAQMITGALGKSNDVEGSIAYLYDLGLSNGRKGKTIDGYEADGLLTRAEALAFLKAIADKNLNKEMSRRDVKQERNASVEKYKQQKPAPTPEKQTSKEFREPSEAELRKVVEGAGYFLSRGDADNYDEGFFILGSTDRQSIRGSAKIFDKTYAKAFNANYYFEVT